MNEKYPYPQHNSGEQPPDDQRRPAPHEPETGDASSIESDNDHDWELRWEISDVILAAIDNLIKHPGPAARAAIFALARKLVEHVYGPAPTDDRQDLTTLTDTVAQRITELADAYDDLTTSDLQGSVGALALRIVRNQLTAGPAESHDQKGGRYE
ncbi:hypothetical protein [Nocardia brasiliensis]|uniref:hypothetical protein n=1 Tax=Nocardia brasiliensis TaxID=37326 RepID=UPI002455E7DE|nr:hypothetical protein [Nocardia brasiliensis]